MPPPRNPPLEHGVLHSRKEGLYKFEFRIIKVGDKFKVQLRAIKTKLNFIELLLFNEPNWTDGGVSDTLELAHKIIEEHKKTIKEKETQSYPEVVYVEKF